MNEDNNNINDLAMEIKLLANDLEELVWAKGWNEKRMVEELKRTKSRIESNISWIKCKIESLKT